MDNIAATITRPTIAWAVAPEDRERYDRWLKCQFDWLNALERRSNGSRNTRRAYERDVLDFFGYTGDAHGGLMPWQATPAHAESWVQYLQTRNLAPSTINRKVAALSSLYRYASQEAVYVGPDGARAPLWPWPNPFGSRGLRSKVSPYGHASYPTADQVAALLAQIDSETVIGLRDLGILHGIFGTTRRVSEWLSLRGQDIHPDGNGGHWFEYRCKGGEHKRQVLPAATWSIVEAYLKADHRWPLPSGHYVFQATPAYIAYRQGYDPAARHISTSYVNALLRRLGRAIGIPDALLHGHALRHAGAQWRKKHGADLWQLKDILGHQSIAMTQVYCDTCMSAPEDPFADTIGAILPKQFKLLFR